MKRRRNLSIEQREERQRLQSRLRSAALRKRVEEAEHRKPKGNRLRSYLVWLLDSEVDDLIKKADNKKTVTEKQRRASAGRAITERAKRNSRA
jgi:hypothetical protein